MNRLEQLRHRWLGQAEPCENTDFGIVGALFRSRLIELTREAAPRPGGWERLRREIAAPTPPPGLWTRLTAALTTPRQTLALAPAVMVLLLVGTLLIGMPADGARRLVTIETALGRLAAAPTAIASLPRNAQASAALSERRAARPLGAMAVLDAIDPLPAARHVGSTGVAGRVGTGAVLPRDLVPDSDRGLLINPFGIGRPRPNVDEPKLPARPGQFRFTTA